MNLRISNLSSNKKLTIVATDSATPFHDTAMDTATDTMLPLVPNRHKIEGTIDLSSCHPESGASQICLTTDKTGENVIVTTANQLDVVIPLHQNIVIEWNEHITDISGY